MAEQTTAGGGTMQQTGEGALAALARMEDAVTGAYDAALGKLRTNKVAPSMQRFRDNHKAHAETLRQWAARTGQTETMSAMLDEFKETVQDAVAQARSFDGVFSTLRVAEMSIKLHYAEAIDTDIPEDAKATLRTCLKDAEEHINFLEVATHGLPEVAGGLPRT